MKKIILITILSFCSFQAFLAQEDFTKYVDPKIGNVAQFLVPTYPTMHLPNQMLRMFPVKYDYLSDEITAFPLQVVSHRSKGILQMRVSLGEITNKTWKAKMHIDHDLEVVKPWFYSTYLIDDDIRVSFVPSKRTAVYKIDFPKGEQNNIIIQGTRDMESDTFKNNAFTFQEKIKYKTKGVNPITREMSAFVYGTITNKVGKPIKGLLFNIKNNKFSVSLKSKVATSLYVKYAVSYISFEQAKINYKKEVASNNFDTLVDDGKKEWEKVINQIEVEGGTKAQKRSFYTSLYRTYERMIDVNEGGKYYSGYDGRVHESDRPFYLDDWIWDTYRAQHPLRTILDPQVENEMLNSYTLMYNQSGWMPTFPQIHGNHMCMNSYHSSAIFIDGYRKGLRDYDIEKAYQGIKKNLTEGTFLPWRQGTPKLPIDDFYHEKGYYPSLKILKKEGKGRTLKETMEEETEPMVDDFEKRQAVAVSLGIAYDFWALAEIAKELGHEKDYQEFTKKANNYKKLWHNELKLFIPKDEDGNWIDVDPKASGGPGYRHFYDENNAWTYAWDVQQDIKGLMELLGGKEKAEARLDQLFREPLGMKKRDFYVNGSNSTGLVGQFSMGNEPSFHIPYLYNYFGAPWKTQKRTRFLLDVWFKDNIFGIPGDEDGGGMTAFVVFSSMGLYPVTPGLPFYDITSPIFEKSTTHLKNGKKFIVLAEGASKTKKYIQKAFINDKEIFSPFITHKQIMEGGTLKLILGELPNKEWGKTAEIPNHK